MKKLILFIAFFINLLNPAVHIFAVPVANHSHSNDAPTVDSLLHLIHTTTGPELLYIYPLLHKALYEVGDIDTHLRYNREFAEAARAAKDKKAEAKAYVLNVEAMYNYRVSDSLLLDESLKALDFMKDVPGAEAHYFFTASTVSDIYMLQGNYEEALRYAEEFYHQAKKMNNSSGLVASLQSMGKAYEELGLLDKAELSFRESIAAGTEWPDRGMKGESYSYLIAMLNAQNRPHEALQICKECEEFLHEIEACNGELRNLCFHNDLGFAGTYIKLGQLRLAREYIEKAEQYPIAATDVGMYMIECERFHLLLEEGKYPEAEQSLDKIQPILEAETSNYLALSKMKESRAELYSRWGKYDKAVLAYKEYITGNDSLQRVELAGKLHALRTQYEVDKLEMQKRQQATLFRNAVISFSVAFLLICTVLVVLVINARRLHAKNCSLLNRIAEQDKLEEENERIRIQLAKKEEHTATNTASPNETDTPLSSLYLRLKELMKDPAVFTNPDINRKMIADMLGTNEKYVFDTIRNYYDMNISDYITNLRLNYARNLLALPSGERTIETIAFDSGFNSRNTFHRLFKEHYGMTPAEFRQLVAG